MAEDGDTPAQLAVVLHVVAFALMLLQSVLACLAVALHVVALSLMLLQSLLACLAVAFHAVAFALILLQLAPASLASRVALGRGYPVSSACISGGARVCGCFGVRFPSNTGRSVGPSSIFRVPAEGV